MLRDLTIERFRGFERFELHGLGRVNLLVGENNSGKTTVLEAVEALVTRGSFGPWWRAMRRRGEVLSRETERHIDREGDICHLFYGHALRLGDPIEISGSGDNESRRCIVGLDLEQSLFSDSDDSEDEGEGSEQSDKEFGAPTLKITWNGQEPIRLKLPISRHGGVRPKDLRRLPELTDDHVAHTRFITTESLSADEVSSLVSDVVLTSEESLVIDALQIIDSSIERIAPAAPGSDRFYPGMRMRGGVFVKCHGDSNRIPIGSMGDGIWRILGLALALVKSERGILLVDEIDTGLHFSAMSKMWKLLYHTADRLNVQVFATTHSRDCIQSLASVLQEMPTEKQDASIQRLERDKGKAVAFTGGEIIAAAERGIEVR